MKTILLSILLLISAPGVALSGNDLPRDRDNPPARTDATDPVADLPDGRTARVSELLIQAVSLVGVKYRRGGDSLDDGFDCSGFVRHVFAESLSLSLPRSAFAMSKLGNPVDARELLPGDLLFYNTQKRRNSHVALYVGEGRFVHAPSRGKRVEIVAMSDAYWTRRFNGARRLVEAD
ncbi:MAG: C40 family peptidase [Betaproteobacteria bacterium]